MPTARTIVSDQLPRWRGWVVALTIVLGFFVLAPVALGAGIGAVERLTGHDDLLLREGTLETRAFVDATVNAVAADLNVAPAPDNANLALAGDLHNNHSFGDQSRPLQYPGYNDCDSWKHIVLDGWSATYRVEITLRDAADADRLLTDTRHFWESRDYEVKATGGSSLFIDGFALHVNALQREASIVGWTDCLPPG